MLDVCSNVRVIRQQGKLGLANHVNIFLAWEKRAPWFSNRRQSCKDHDEVLYKDTLDGTGTVETADLSNSDANSVWGEHQKQFTTTTREQGEIRGIEDEVLDVHE